MNAPICKTVTCKRELTYLEDTKCWRCLVCKPLPKGTEVLEEVKKEYIDRTVNENTLEARLVEFEEKVREIVRDELENWHIQKPSVTATEIQGLTQDVVIKDEVGLEPHIETWRQTAKRLNIPLAKETGGARKKVDVLADIEAKQTEPVPV